MLFALQFLLTAVITRTIQLPTLLFSPTPQLNCQSYHGLLNDLYLYSDCSDNVKGERIPFGGFERGRVMISRDSNVESWIKAERSLQRDLEMEFHLSDQITFNNSPQPQFVTLYYKKGLQLIQFLSNEKLLEFTSSPEFELVELVALTNLPFPSDISTQSTVDERSTQRIIDQLDALKFSPSINNLITQAINVETIKQDVRKLESFPSRNSMSEGGLAASKWLLERLSSFEMNCTHQYFAAGFSPNVICYIPGINQPSSAVILSAHYDGRGTFGSVRAPAANDDGSGSSLILSIARAVYENKLKFYHDVYINLFAGEEQGLLGSAFFAKSLKDSGVDVKLMVQADMVAYRKPGENFQLALPDLIGLTEARYLLGNISSIYVPQLEVGTTPACCSDHQSFDNLGYASTWVFERNGPIADNRYHNSGDISNRPGFDFEQIQLITKVVLATLLEVAEFVYSF